jgi:predicted DNA-binding antitoxin AbrB/MazE fold protein
VTDGTGALTSQQRYLPFGQVRTDIGSISQTDFGYTGQRKLDDGLGGIMDYKARFYSPYISEYRIILLEAEMESFTVQAVYEKGVLKPKKKLNLPEHSIVELRVRAARSARQKTPFAALIGVWEHLPEKEVAALERALVRTRKRSASKVQKLAKTVK